MSDPSPTPTGAVAETPEAGPVVAAPTPPAWRDQFADPILQPGQQHGGAPTAPLAATPEAGPVAAGTPPSSSTAPPPVAPLARSEETVLAPGQVSPEAIVKSVKEFVEAPAEQRDARARALGRQLRPLAADAEKFVAKALNLGARGLNGLAARLEQRRREREGTGSGEPPR